MSGLPVNYLLQNQATSPDQTAKMNQQQWFFAKITGNAGSNPVRHSWSEVIPVPNTLNFVVKDGGRVGVAAGPNPAVALNGGLVGNNTIVVMRVGTFDPTYDWLYLIIQATGGGTPQVLVQITSRTYPGGGSPFALYSSNFVTDNTSPSALTYTVTGTGPDFYSLNDVDLPVGLVCWVYLSANGNWYLNDNDTRVDIVRKTSTTPDANGLYDGVLERYIDGSFSVADRGSIKVLDITGP